jgi:hypothetical protein
METDPFVILTFCDHRTIDGYGRLMKREAREIRGNTDVPCSQVGRSLGPRWWRSAVGTGWASHSIGGRSSGASASIPRAARLPIGTLPSAHRSAIGSVMSPRCWARTEITAMRRRDGGSGMSRSSRSECSPSTLCDARAKQTRQHMPGRQPSERVPNGCGRPGGRASIPRAVLRVGRSDLVAARPRCLAHSCAAPSGRPMDARGPLLNRERHPHAQTSRRDTVRAYLPDAWRWLNPDGRQAGLGSSVLFRG